MHAAPREIAGPFSFGYYPNITQVGNSSAFLTAPIEPKAPSPFGDILLLQVNCNCGFDRRVAVTLLGKRPYSPG